MAEYCCSFVCCLHGKCDTEYLDGCSPCEFEYDCEFCRNHGNCDAEAETEDDWGEYDA